MVRNTHKGGYLYGLELGNESTEVSENIFPLEIIMQNESQSSFEQNIWTTFTYCWENETFQTVINRMLSNY